jgi:hypothetical protein
MLHGLERKGLLDLSKQVVHPLLVVSGNATGLADDPATLSLCNSTNNHAYKVVQIALLSHV